MEITTAGDVDRARGDKSRWTGALEAALLAGDIDLAVHSAKDVPGELAEGTAIVAAPRRADPLDVLVGEHASTRVREGARVGTSALRRRAQLLAARPDLEVAELRGNVDTRLRKLAAGEVDVLVLAAAGLERLDRRDEAGGRLDGELFVPAAGPGRDRRPGADRYARRRCRLRRVPCGHDGVPAGGTGRDPGARRELSRSRGRLGTARRRDVAHPRLRGPARRLRVGARRARGAGRAARGRRPRARAADAARRRGRRAARAPRRWPRERSDDRTGGAPRSGGIVHLVGAGPGRPGAAHACARSS